jgi:hypothetical protein
VRELRGNDRRARQHHVPNGAQRRRQWAQREEARKLRRESRHSELPAPRLHPITLIIMFTIISLAFCAPTLTLEARVALENLRSLGHPAAY